MVVVIFTNYIDFFKNFFIIAVSANAHSNLQRRHSVPPAKKFLTYVQNCSPDGEFCTPLFQTKKSSLAGSFLLYNVVMDYITVVINSFWLIMQQITVVFVPILAILLIFSIVRGLIFNDR